MFGFMGKILIVDVTTRTVEFVTRDEPYYKKYLGGSFLAAKLFDEQVGNKRDLSPFAPNNPLVFAPGVLAGKAVCGATRVNLFSMSPETPGVFLSQAGGEFGPNIKRAGFDALVIKGKSDKPTVITISNDNVGFEDGESFWGMDRVEVYTKLKEKLGPKTAIASIGIAGENKVCNANIMFEPDHYAGRGGMGAVLGAKNIKAICINGDQKPTFADEEQVKTINKTGSKAFKTAFENFPNDFLGVLRNYGTWGLLQLNQIIGNIPVKNFNETFLTDEASAQEISHDNGQTKYVGKRVPCKGCYVACKKSSKLENQTALPEYESLSLLGPNLGISNAINMIEACELCNHLGVDTMSIGNMLGFVMDCSEHGLLPTKDLDFSLHYGDTKGTLELINDIVFQKGPIGELLAKGVESLCERIGESSRQYLRFSKGVGIPAHLPRVKPGIGFGYLHGPNPGDHMKLEHDWIATVPDLIKDFGIETTSNSYDLDNAKVEIARATQIYYSAMDTLSMCMFIFGPGNILSYDQIVQIVNGATGFDFTFADLMKIGENAVQLQRKLFLDFGGSDEKLLAFMEKEIPHGPTKGQKIDRDDFEKTRKHYYSLWHWDNSGRPSQDIIDQIV